MTKAELIAALEDVPDDASVVVWTLEQIGIPIVDVDTDDIDEDDPVVFLEPRVTLKQASQEEIDEYNEDDEEAA